MKDFVLDYVNENEFRKLERSLKKYNMRAYKIKNTIMALRLKDTKNILVEKL